MADYNFDWTSIGKAQGSTNPNVGGSQFGQNINNGNRMQPDAYYSDMFLERKRLKGEDLVFANYAESREIKKGLDTIVLKRYQPLKAHTIPLIEGHPPIGDKAHGKAIRAKTRQYGRFMEFTDLFEVKVADPVIETYSVELADLVNETVDMLAQAALLAEAQVFYAMGKKAGTATNATRPTTTQALVDAAITGTNTYFPNIEDLRVIKLTMEAAKIRPIGGTYVVLTSPAVFYDLQTSPIAEKYMQYGQTNASLVNDGIPSMYGLSFRKALSAKTELLEGSKVGTVDNTGKSITVHHTIVLGAKAYSRIEIAGNGGTQFFREGLGSAGTLDPLHQRQTMGWKINALGFKVTDPDAVVDYISVPEQSEIVMSDFDVVTDIVGEMGVSTAMAKQKLESLGVDTAVFFTENQSITSDNNKVQQAIIDKPIVAEQFEILKDTAAADKATDKVDTRATQAAKKATVTTK